MTTTLQVLHGIGVSAGTASGPAVLACCGATPALEVLAAASVLLEHLPELRLRIVDVVDLMTLQSEADHPHGLSDAAHDALFTTDRPVVLTRYGLDLPEVREWTWSRP